MNKILLSGNILAKADCISYYAGHDGKKSVVTFPVSVQRPFAKKDESGYYPSDIWQVKAFDKLADLINNNFKPGSGVIIDGYLTLEPAREVNGVTYPARTAIVANNIEFSPRDRSTAGNAANTTVHAARTTNMGVKAPTTATAGTSKVGGFKLF